jgi:DNA-binding transcriptional ArsR family regulator
MVNNAMFSEVAALLGSPARTAMLQALMDGRAASSSELARIAGVAVQTASEHLSRLTVGGLVIREKRGRCHYHRLASVTVARMIESVMLVASELEPQRARRTIGPREAALRFARTCYDHLAGRLGVALADSMTERGFVELSNDTGIVTPSGVAFLAQLGLDLGQLVIGRNNKPDYLLCRPCLDWSEGRPHLAGAFGVALCAHCFDRRWIERIAGTSALLVTHKGSHVFREQFGASIE